MNERFFDLAKTLPGWTSSDDGAYIGPQTSSLKRYAELIVKECAHLVGGYTKENEFGTDVKEAYEEITKHFGVE